MNHECSICQDVIINMADSTTLEHCNHSFHRLCIQKWFNISENCPNCRGHVENTSDCEIIKELRSEQTIHRDMIRQLTIHNEILSVVNNSLQSASIFSLPWYRDGILELTFAIVPTTMVNQFPHNIIGNSFEDLL